jgi:acylphosphatase
MKTVKITISGKVQGVFFRQGTKEKALELGLVGTVENLSNGNVCVTATGDQASLEKLVTWCRQGPPRARVQSLHAEEIPLQYFKDFSVRR